MQYLKSSFKNLNDSCLWFALVYKVLNKESYLQYICTHFIFVYTLFRFFPFWIFMVTFIGVGSYNFCTSGVTFRFSRINQVLLPWVAGPQLTMPWSETRKFWAVSVMVSKTRVGREVNRRFCFHIPPLLLLWSIKRP